MAVWKAGPSLLGALHCLRLRHPNERHRASRLVAEGAQALAAANGGEPAFDGEAWNGCLMDMVRLAKAHAYLVLQHTYAAHVRDLQDKGTLPASTAAALADLCSLFGLRVIDSQMGDFLEDGYLSRPQALWVREAQAGLLRDIRPNAVALVDGFGFEDYLLHSALGRRDGDVYRALLDMAQDSPLNNSGPGPAWDGILEPRLNPKSRVSSAAGAKLRDDRPTQAKM